MRNFFCAMMALLLSGCAAGEISAQMNAIPTEGFYMAHLAGRECSAGLHVVREHANPRDFYIAHLYSFHADGTAEHFVSFLDSLAGSPAEYENPARTVVDARSRGYSPAKFAENRNIRSGENVFSWTSSTAMWTISMEDGQLWLRNLYPSGNRGSGRMECAPRL